MIDLNAAYDRDTVAIMEQILRPDSSCVDVGCHSGTFLREILRLAPRGQHFAFEPLPELFAQLQHEFRDVPNALLYQLALSDTAGEAAFQHVVTNPGYSGLRRRTYPRSDETVAEIRVRTAPLDSLIPHGHRVDFIKIDVESAELQVVRGAIRTIRESRAVVVFEHGLGAADRYGTTPEAMYNLLQRECGLQASLLDAWLRGGAALSRPAFAEQFRSGANFYFVAHP